MNLQALMDRSAEAHKKGQAIVEQADPENKGLSPEKVVEANKWFDEADSWKLQADTMERSEKLKKGLGDPKYKHPMGHAEAVKDLERETGRKVFTLGETQYTSLLKGDERFKRSKAFDAKLSAALSAPEYSPAFEAYLRFGRDMLEPTELKALSSLTDPEGGFIVTEEFRTEVIRKLRNLVHIRERATVIQTQAAGVGFPTFDPPDSQTAPPVTVEGATITQYNLSNVFGKTQFTPHKRSRILALPVELIEDAVIDVSALLTDFLAMRFAEIEENDFIQGTGVNMPLGLTKANGIPTINIAGSTTAMVPEDIVTTVYGMRAVYRKDAAFVMHRLVIQAIRLFRTNIGGANTGTFMFQPSMQAGEPPSLFGYPLLESEFMPNPYASPTNVSGTPMLLFGNLKFYWIVDRVDLMVQRLVELYAANDQIGYRMRKRTDAAPVLADPFLMLLRK